MANKTKIFATQMVRTDAILALKIPSSIFFSSSSLTSLLQQLLDGHAQIICDLLWKISLFRGILPLSNTKEIL